MIFLFFFSSRRRHTRYIGDWSSECALPISLDQPKQTFRMMFVFGRAAQDDAQSDDLEALGGQRNSKCLCVGRPERSEERRVGKECRSRRAGSHREKNGRTRGVVGASTVQDK